MIDVITAKLGIAHDMLATQAAGVEQAAVAGKVRQRDGRLRVTIAGAVGVVFLNVDSVTSGSRRLATAGSWACGHWVSVMLVQPWQFFKAQVQA